MSGRNNQSLPIEDKKDVSSRVSVCVRVRPLTTSEKAAGTTILEGLTMTSSPDESVGNAVALVSTASGSSIDGFANVLGKEASNRDVFEKCFSERLPTVLRGGTASLFCYGYTGGGKTHTVVGYGKEKGIFFLAAEELLNDLKRLDKTTDDVINEEKSGTDKDEDDTKLFLSATACEIYLDSVFDILGPTKEPCTLRVGADGQLAITRELKSEQSEDVAPSNIGEHTTLVTKAAGLRAIPIHRPQDLDPVSQTCVAQRACGTSTANHTSSRSHAVLRLEVVSKATNRVRDGLQQLKAELPALKNARDNFKATIFRVKCGEYVRVFRHQNLQLEHSKKEKLHPSDLIIDHVTETQKFALKDVQGGNAPCTAEEWSEKLNLPPLKVIYVQQLKEYPGGEAEREAFLCENQEELSRINVLITKKEKEMFELADMLQRLAVNGPAALGGSMLLVDLAGADYDHRGGKVQKESTAINKSLLALKECFRALSFNNNNILSPKSCVHRPPFRNSKLTRILEDSLLPSDNSSRRNKESTCVMLVNVSPASHLKSGTVNALRYGQMYSVGRNTNKSPSFASSSSEKSNIKNKAKGEAVTFAEKAIIVEIRRIYKQYVPDKSEEETEAILKKFKGRERGLLKKVKDKYSVAPAEVLSV